jgi:hypothetical protein
MSVMRENTSTRTNTNGQYTRQSDRRFGGLGWWYRFSAPPASISEGSFLGRETYRRGKLISLVLLLQLILTFFLLVAIGIFTNRAVAPSFITMAALLVVAALLNRRGHILYAGTIAVVAVDISMLLNILSYHALSTFMLPMFDLLAIPELFAVSLLPPRAVFIDAAFHICFIIAALTFLFPQSAELSALLHSASLLQVLMRPIVMQVMVAAVAYFLVRSTTRAMKRADRATSIAMLEQEMADQGVLIAEEKQQLEESMRQIVAVHMQVANGDYSARVPLGEGNALWEIAGPLNTLLSRLQHYRQDAYLLEKTNEAVNYFLQARSRAGNGPVVWQKTNTPIDSVAQQHNSFTRSTQSMRYSDQQTSHSKIL